MSAKRLAAGAIASLAAAGVAVAPVHARGVADAAAAPTVQAMIVGDSGSALFAARTVSASATAVSIAGRNCAVAAGTPLAVLAAIRRAGGPSFALRDYGHCNGAPANSAELFVYTLGGEANLGQNGWEYKVNGVSGTTGAADTSGPSGDGQRLRSGERVLWFWCEAVSGGCERTLEVSPSATTVAPGASLSVTVDGYENEGRAAAIAGAIVTLGTDFASTAANGRATLLAPTAPGRYQLSATRQGTVQSFPRTILVR